MSRSRHEAIALRSRRMVMRPVCEDDAESLLPVFRNPSVRRYLLDDELRLGFTEIEAAADVPNERSVAVLERLGMAPMDIEDEEFHGLVFYKIDSKSWRAQ